jgi:hypothetical protein
VISWFQRLLSNATCTATLRCLSQVVQYFSKTAGELLMVPLGCAAMLFHSIAPSYHAAHVAVADDDEFDPAQDSDGEEMSLEVGLTLFTLFCSQNTN